MAQDRDAVRQELTSRVATLDGRARLARPPELAQAVEDIRLLAQRHGLHPTITVAHVMAGALARGERGVVAWLPLLRDAVGAERQDRAAGEAFAAACSARLAI